MSRQVTIDRNASSGVLWGLMAWHVNRLADRTIDLADHRRSALIVALSRDELSERHGSGSVLANFPGAAQ